MQMVNKKKKINELKNLKLKFKLKIKLKII